MHPILQIYGNITFVKPCTLAAGELSTKPTRSEDSIPIGETDLSVR